MARHRAQDIVISHGSGPTLVTAITGGTFSQTASTVETTAGGDTNRNRKPGYKDWALNGTSRYEGADIPVNTQVTVTFAVKDTAGSDVKVYTGPAICTQFDVGGEHDGGAVDATFAFVAAGALTE